MSISFDDLDGLSNSPQTNDEPFWKVIKKGDKEIHKWLVQELDFLRNENRQRIDEIRRHYDIYKGVTAELRTRTDDRDRIVDKSRVQRKVVVNHLYDLTEQRVARLAKYKPAVAFLPNNDEFKDKIASKVTKMYWDHIKRVSELDDKVRRSTRVSNITGEGYIATEWDKDEGPEHPDSKALREKGDDKNKDDKIESNDTPVYVGEVVHRLVRPEHLLFSKEDEFDKCEYYFERELKNVDYLKKKYPDKASDIKSNKAKDIFFEGNDKNLEQRNSCVQWTFYYKKCKSLPQGRKAIFTEDVTLEDSANPYDHGGFPLERLPDIEIPGEQHAKSFFINTRQLAAQYNNLTTMILRNQKMCAHPKWFMPKGACKIESLNNDISIVQYTGGQPPILSQANPTPSEVFGFRDALKEEMQQLAAVYGVSRGEPPPGIKAGVALQFLNEQENERENSRVANYNDYIRRIARKTVQVAAQYYDESDQRTLKVVGKNNAWMVKKLEPEFLATVFDVKVQNSSALPESKAQRVQTIIDLNESFPGILPQEQVLDLMDFGQTEKFYDEAAASIRAAEAESDSILYDGKEIEAEEYELHIEHWRSHVSKIQDISFKLTIPKDKQKSLKDHIMSHEMFMLDVMIKKNPGYQELLVQLKQFPMFYTPDSMAEQPPIPDEMEMIPPLPQGGQEGPPPPQGETSIVADQELEQMDMPPVQPGGEAVEEMPPPPIEPTGEI